VPFPTDEPQQGINDEPDLEGGPISFEAYCEGTPEKLELVDGLLIASRSEWGDEPREADLWRRLR